MGDYERQRSQASRIIRNRGQAAKLKRGSELRDCYALEVALSASDKSKLRNPTNRVFLIDAVDLDVPPEFGKDALVWPDKVTGTDKTFRQEAPTEPLQPGDVVIYYEIQVAGPI